MFVHAGLQKGRYKVHLFAVPPPHYFSVVPILRHHSCIRISISSSDNNNLLESINRKHCDKWHAVLNADSFLTFYRLHHGSVKARDHHLRTRV